MSDLLTLSQLVNTPLLMVLIAFAWRYDRRLLKVETVLEFKLAHRSDPK